MQTLFIALFSAGIITTLISLILISEDKNKKKDIPMSVRPLYLLIIAIVCWAMTYPALLAPEYQTVLYPSYTISSNTITSGTWTNTIFSYPQYNVTTNVNWPLKPATIAAYTVFWVAMLIVHLVILFFWMLTFTADRFDESVYGKD